MFPPPLDKMWQRRKAAARIVYVAIAISVAVLVTHNAAGRGRIILAAEIFIAAVIPVAVYVGVERLVLRLWRMPKLHLPLADANRSSDLSDFEYTPNARQCAPMDFRWRDGQRGRNATFTYTDADGVVTDRRVTNWLSDGPYIRAHCLTRAETRTFRKAQIEDWRS